MEQLNTSGADLLIFGILLAIVGFILTRKKKS